MPALGLIPGDRIGVWSTNCAEWVALQYGCALSGFVLVNVNPAYRSHELSYVLNRSRIRALILHERDHRADYRLILEEALAKTHCTLRHALYIGSSALAESRLHSAGEPHLIPPPATSPTSSTRPAPRVRPRACCSRTRI